MNIIAAVIMVLLSFLTRYRINVLTKACDTQGSASFSQFHEQKKISKYL